MSLAAVAPGRVNLIGEHIDYNGLAVLPIATDRNVRIDFRVTQGPVVRLDNAAERFAAFEFRLDEPISAAAQGHWSNYVRAAAQGLVGHGTDLRRGIEGTVTGNVPIAVGLSSSSALVVAAALALLRANGVVLPRLELAALMARAERFVGLEGGGMDQAASLCGVAGHALRIEFDPLRVTPVAVPRGWRWVVASSLARAEKSAGAREAYNERARRSREAVRGLGDWGARRVAAGVTGEGSAARERCDAVGSGRGCAGVAYRDLARVEDVKGLLRHARRVLSPVLFRRFRHVVTEGRRVMLAEAAMRNGDIGRFGELMVRSHESLRDDCEVSTPGLDEIVGLALEAGAAGARLTGAGFGGCAVVLCEEGSAKTVMEALAKGFYEPRLGRPPTGDEVIAVKESGGAAVVHG